MEFATYVATHIATCVATEGESERHYGHQVHSAGWIYGLRPGVVSLQQHHLQP